MMNLPGTADQEVIGRSEKVKKLLAMKLKVSTASMGGILLTQQLTLLNKKKLEGCACRIPFLLFAFAGYGILVVLDGSINCE